MSCTTTTRPGLLAACAGRACACALAGVIASGAIAQERDPFNTAQSTATSGVEVSEYLTVDLHVQDESLGNVLQMLSIQSERNIVMSSDVSATVTADLYNVTFHEALEAILNINGYGYLERGNFIYVYTLEEIAQIEQANRIPVSKVVQLNYLNANDAAEFCSPLLSEIGQIKTNGDVDLFNVPDDNPIGDEQFALSATMVLFDYPEHVEEIEKLIKQLDTKPSQVLVEATILQTALTEANAFGVDFSFLNDINFTDFITAGGPLGVANALIRGGTGAAGEGVSPANNQAIGGASTVGNTAGPGGFKVAVIEDDFALFVKLLDEVSDTTVLSNPKILAVNRAPARVLVGERVGYLNTTSTETSTTQSVEFLDTGTQLSFRPFISTNGDIRMELNPSVSEGVIRQATDSNGANVTIPDEITQELTTNVIVRDGATIVLGGLFKETTVVGRRQVPWIGDLPIIGAAFRGHDDSTDRAEIIFMVTPTIMNDEVLIAQGDAATQALDRVRTGTRTGLLPWSRDRMTAKLNVEAERLVQEGDTEKALWKLRRSLNLNPNQPEAIELREDLLGKQEHWPSRSILDRVMDREYETSPMNMGFSPKSVVPPQTPKETKDAKTTSATKAAPSATTTDAEDDSVAQTPTSPFLPFLDLPVAGESSPHAAEVNDLQLTLTMTPTENDAVDTPVDEGPVEFAPIEMSKPAPPRREFETALLDKLISASSHPGPHKPNTTTEFSTDAPQHVDTTTNDFPSPASNWFLDPMSLADSAKSKATSSANTSMNVEGPEATNPEIESPLRSEPLMTVDTTPLRQQSTPAEMSFLVGDGPIPPRYSGVTLTSGWRTLQDIFGRMDQPVILPGAVDTTIVEVDPEKN